VRYRESELCEWLRRSQVRQVGTASPEPASRQTSGVALDRAAASSPVSSSVRGAARRGGTDRGETSSTRRRETREDKAASHDKSSQNAHRGACGPSRRVEADGLELSLSSRGSQSRQSTEQQGSATLLTMHSKLQVVGLSRRAGCAGEEVWLLLSAAALDEHVHTVTCHFGQAAADDAQILAPNVVTCSVPKGLAEGVTGLRLSVSATAGTLADTSSKPISPGCSMRFKVLAANASEVQTIHGAD